MFYLFYSIIQVVGFSAKLKALPQKLNTSP